MLRKIHLTTAWNAISALTSRVESLERENESLHDNLRNIEFKLNNPAKFKSGDKVRVCTPTGDNTIKVEYGVVSKAWIEPRGNHRNGFIQWHSPARNMYTVFIENSACILDVEEKDLALNL